jgi:50S ribosomal subunit-associated GTPase HflX
VVATKTDALDEPERLAALKKRARKDGKAFFAISAVTNDGVKDLVDAVARRLDDEKASSIESIPNTAVS